MYNGAAGVLLPHHHRRYCSEILSIFLLSGSPVRMLMGQQDGIELLLRSIFVRLSDALTLDTVSQFTV